MKIFFKTKINMIFFVKLFSNNIFYIFIQFNYFIDFEKEKYDYFEYFLFIIALKLVIYNIHDSNYLSFEDI